MNHKAQLEPPRKTIEWGVLMIVITIVIFGTFMILANYKGKLSITPPEVRAELLSQRFTDLPECFVYQDNETKRVFPGIIDLDKFNKGQMNKCYFTEPETGTQDYNFELVLKNQNLKVSTNNFFNKVAFTLYRDVLVKKGNLFLEDQLAIYVQVKI